MSKAIRYTDEPKHRANYSFNKPVILFHYIVQVFALSDFDALFFMAIVLLDSGSVGATFVDVD